MDSRKSNIEHPKAVASRIKPARAAWIVGLMLLVVGPIFPLNPESPSRPEGSADLLSIRIVPENVTIRGAHGSQRFLVLGTFADRMERDLTAASRLTVADSQLIAIGERGLARPLTDGTTQLKAEFEGHAATSAIKIVDSQKGRPFNFQRDIGGILTEKGCNGSYCHGGVKGKGGFKLSLNALYAHEDYKWIINGGTFQVLTPEPAGELIPRINLEQPDQSLLLLKPTFKIPHGGGKLIKLDDAEYQTLLNWIREGGRYTDESEDHVEVVGIEVFPKEAVLDLEGKRQILVTASLLNGEREDYTHQVHYKSNNGDVAKVTDEGQVKAVAPGETTVVIRAAGHQTTATVGVISEPIPDYPDFPRANFIDEHVFAKLRRFHILPSELSDDGEFLRRVCLDVAGRLPPAHRVKEFLADPDPDKREKLIEVLLESPEYAEYWTWRLADVTRVALYASGYSNKGAQYYWEWVRDSIDRNKPYDQIAKERIAAQGQGMRNPSYHFAAADNFVALPQPETVMGEQMRVFTGRRFECAQCHNHPFEPWSQNQFWGLTAYFGQLAGFRVETGPDDFKGILVDTPGGAYGDRGQGGPIIHPRTKEQVAPAFLDGTPLPETKGMDPRMELAERIVAHPFFAEAAVNRTWSYFFGKGLVNPVDDFRTTNPPTHPDLLQALAADFRESGYDLKHLIRTIVNSRTYQLSNRPNASNVTDETNYSRTMARPLDAEVLLDAVSDVVDIPEVFTRVSMGTSTLPAGTRAVQLKTSDAVGSLFMDVFGRPDRQSIPEREGKASVTQAMHMLAGVTYTDKLSGAGGRVDRLLNQWAGDHEIIEELSLAALTRYPTEEELTILGELIHRRTSSLSHANFGRVESRKRAVEDMVWGLISSREFAYNH